MHRLEDPRECRPCCRTACLWSQGEGQESTKRCETDYRNKEKQIGENRIIRQGETESGKIDHREKQRRNRNRGTEERKIRNRGEWTICFVSKETTGLISGVTD